MRIDDLSPSQDLRSTGVGRTQDVRPEERVPGRKPDSATDTASLSSLSVALSRAINGESPNEQARIERLQEAVSNGTYNVSSSEVASRIVGSALMER